MSNQMFSHTEESHNQHGSIFSQLLHYYSNPQNILLEGPSKLFDIQEWVNQQEEIKNHHKSSGQWVWADEDQFDNQQESQQYQFKQQAATTDNFQLRRVKSLRIEQQDKVTMFLRKQSVLTVENDKIQEQYEEPQRIFNSPNKRSTLGLKSQSLSPRKCKSKKIDKIKQFKLI